jgi:hypothetical protein
VTGVSHTTAPRKTCPELFSLQKSPQPEGERLITWKYFSRPQNPYRLVAIKAIAHKLSFSCIMC